MRNASPLTMAWYCQGWDCGSSHFTQNHTPTKSQQEKIKQSRRYKKDGKLLFNLSQVLIQFGAAVGRVSQWLPLKTASTSRHRIGTIGWQKMSSHVTNLSWEMQYWMAAEEVSNKRRCSGKSRIVWPGNIRIRKKKKHLSWCWREVWQFIDK